MLPPGVDGKGATQIAAAFACFQSLLRRRGTLSLNQLGGEWNMQGLAQFTCHQQGLVIAALAQSGRMQRNRQQQLWQVLVLVVNLNLLSKQAGQYPAGCQLALVFELCDQLADRFVIAECTAGTVDAALALQTATAFFQPCQWQGQGTDRAPMFQPRQTGLAGSAQIQSGLPFALAEHAGRGQQPELYKIQPLVN
jgi:hypothetical protein